MLLGLALPSACFAGSIAVVTSPAAYPGAMPQQSVVFTAAAGEHNRVVVSPTVFGIGAAVSRRVVHDAGARLIAGRGCSSLDEYTVRCDLQVGLEPLAINAGDGDDTVTVPSHYESVISVQGGDGADTLTGAARLSGGSGPDVLVGGDDPSCHAKVCDAPSDVLVGDGGDDMLRGGAGDDVLIGDGGMTPASPDPGAGNDVIDGGVGDDIVTYAGRSAGVRVDLADPAPDGGPGERDQLTGIERVTGGDGADLLVGDNAENSLRGGPGDDLLDGRGGDDDIDGEGGVDSVSGGDGDDQIVDGIGGDALLGGAGDDVFVGRITDGLLLARTVKCGAGRDRVSLPQGQLLSGCEDASVSGIRAAIVTVRPGRRRDGGLRFVATCHEGMRCEMTLTVRRRSSLRGRRRVSVPTGRPRSFVVRARRSTRPGEVLDVAVSGRVITDDPPGAIPFPFPFPATGFAARWRVAL